MKTVFKCQYGNEHNSINPFDLHALANFKLEILDDRIILKSANKQKLRQREFKFVDIDKLVLSLAIGNYTPAYVVSMTIKYLYDLNIYTMNNKWTLEFRSQSEVLSCIEKLKEKDLRIDDPAGVYNIISTRDRLEVEKYFIRHSKQLEAKCNIDSIRSFEDYIDD